MSRVAHPSAGQPRVEVVSAVSADDVAAVRTLVDAATAHDGVVPLGEHVLLHLKHGGDRADKHLLVRDDAGVVGYAHLDPTDPVEGASGEVVVRPDHRRHGVGTALVREMLAQSSARSPGGSHRLRLWAHGHLPGSQTLAESLGFVRARDLWQMRRDMTDELPPPYFPDGVAVRTFEPGRDETAWVEVNARAFADHPEQGAMTIDDLRQRMAESWFDPAGFFLAERAGRLVGFHWTKVHGGDGSSSGGHGHPPIGEVYVVGVDPAAQGGGLGKALTLIGLHHLRQVGVDQVMLYVESDNRPAIAVYESLGFTRYSVDVMYAHG